MRVTLPVKEDLDWLRVAEKKMIYGNPIVNIIST